MEIETEYEHLSAAILSDALDSLGLRNQVMEPGIRPLTEDAVVCGRARTGRCQDIYHIEQTFNAHGPLVGLIDSLAPGEVLVMACGRSGRMMPIGEILCTASQVRGAAGFVTDGQVRDVRQIRGMGFPAFCSGASALHFTGRGKLIASDVPIRCGGVWVSPGDLIYGDADGVIVVPPEAEEEVLRLARIQANVDAGVREAFDEGASLRGIYQRFGAF